MNEKERREIRKEERDEREGREKRLEERLFSLIALPNPTADEYSMIDSLRVQLGINKVYCVLLFY